MDIIFKFVKSNSFNNSLIIITFVMIYSIKFKV